MPRGSPRHLRKIMEQPQTPLTPLSYIPSEIACAQDYEALAHQFIEPKRLAYIEGGSGHDRTLQLNRDAFQKWGIIPRPFADMTHATTALTLGSHALEHPFLLAPVAYQKLVHPNAELATAQAAAATDTTMVSSTLSSVTMEDIAEHSGAMRWFQLYLQPDEQNTTELVIRAVKSDYQAIVVTVDAAVQSPSIRALRAGFVMPNEITAANLESQFQKPHEGVSKSRIFSDYMVSAPTFARLEKLIRECPLPVIIKGVLSPQDAAALHDLGAAGIVVSNHGGRTLDGTPASLDLLPAIRDAVGDRFPVLLDSGIRSGSDAFKAIALGADAVLIGRLQVYALSVAGALGVAHMLKLLREEFELCMAMTGCQSVTAIRSTTLHSVMRASC